VKPALRKPATSAPQGAEENRQAMQGIIQDLQLLGSGAERSRAGMGQGDAPVSLVTG